MGDSKSAPNDPQLEMQRLSLALEQGSLRFFQRFDLSSSRYSDAAEVTELAKMAAPFDTRYTTHMRNEVIDCWAVVKVCKSRQIAVCICISPIIRQQARVTGARCVVAAAYRCGAKPRSAGNA